jgi:hypothetical protein
MKLKFYKEECKKIYTLKEEIKGKEIHPAHYKYIKIKSAEEKPESN